MKEQPLFAALGLAFLCSQASAVDGCTVLLCLANPNGPKAVAECVPPINELYRDLARGRPFPPCEMGGSSHAQPGMSYYDVCPTGTTALPTGSYAIQSAQVPSWVSPNQPLFTGISDGQGLTPSFGDNWNPLPGKVCVGNKVGETSVASNPYDYEFVRAGVYDQVTVLDAQTSPRIIDVFIDNQLYRRVRW